jgi:hypothetical protein
MQAIAALGGLSFIVASLVTGARLLLVAKRTRELPAAVLGFGLFLMGGLGYPMTLLAEFGTFLPDTARAGLVAANTLSGVVGLSLFAFFTARVFRGESTVARAAVWIVAALFCTSFGLRAMGQGFAPLALGGAPQPLLHVVVTVVTLGWAGIESLLVHGQLRKRMRLGLSDPLLVNRMWLWAQGMLCAMLLTGISSTFALLGIPFNQTIPGILTIGIMGSVAAGSIWFAFFPPDTYMRWIRAHGAATAS